MSKWQELLPDGKPEASDTYTWGEPASAEAITELESKVGGPLPGELKEFLAAHDGVYSQYDDGLVLGTAQLADVALQLRDEFGDEDTWPEAQPDKLLAFGSWTGTGDLYCYHLESGKIVHFLHEDGEAIDLAEDLEELLTKQANGEL